jgi:glycosyltransferase involved in cell wall biosynthesis
MALIGIDCRFASKDVGLGTYTRELVLQLVHSSTDDFVLFVRSTSEPWLEEIPSHTAILTANFDHYSLREQIAFPRLIRHLHLDLFFSPHFNVPYFCPVPFVVTIHDLILHRYPNQTSKLKQVAYRILMKRAVTKAKKIISVSEYTQSELLSVYGESIESKIHTVTEGVNPLFSSSDTLNIQKKYSLPTDYLLYVGNAKQHKNVQMLIDAHAGVPDAPDLVLISGGCEARNLQINERVHLLQNIPYADLPSFYQSARCFVTPSLYEGFCLPILEARASGCPVIAMNITAIPEVAGPHTRLIEPTLHALADALRHIPTKTSGPEEEYSWEYAATTTNAILTLALHHGQN